MLEATSVTIPRDLRPLELVHPFLAEHGLGGWVFLSFMHCSCVDLSSMLCSAQPVDPGVSCLGFRPLGFKRDGGVIGVDFIGRAPRLERQARLLSLRLCVGLCSDWYGVPRLRTLGFVEESRVAVFGHSIAR